MVQIKCFVVRAITLMVSNVTLANQVKGSREQQSHPHTYGIIEPPVGMQNSVFGFVNDRIDRVAQNCKNDRQPDQVPPVRGQRCCVKDQSTGGQLHAHDPKVPANWNWILQWIGSPRCGPRVGGHRYYWSEGIGCGLGQVYQVAPTNEYGPCHAMTDIEQRTYHLVVGADARKSDA